MRYKAILRGLEELATTMGPGALVRDALARGHRWQYSAGKRVVVLSVSRKGRDS